MCSELLQGGCNCRWLVPFLLRDEDANIGEVNYSYMKVPGNFVGESTILKPKRLSKGEMTTHSRTRNVTNRKQKMPNEAADKAGHKFCGDWPQWPHNGTLRRDRDTSTISLQTHI